MTDLTRGPVGRHLAGMAVFIGAGLVFQAAYFIVDLYFVSRIGPQAVAGVSAAGNFMFLALAAAQLVSVGALSLISQAAGRRDETYANLVFNQVCGLSLIMSAAMLLLGYLLAGPASLSLGADAASAASGRAYLYGYIPALAAMFPGNAISSALRATGIVRPTMLLQTASVLVNALLAPVLIAGWGTGHPLGAFGAGLASSIAAVSSLIAIVLLLPRLQTLLRADRAAFRPRVAVWISLMRVGLPAAGEFLMMFLVTAIIYLCIRRFGAQAQAGYGIGTRVMQAVFLPTMAVAFAAAPIAGQNVGARRRDRVVQTFRLSAGLGTAFMVALTVLCQFRPALLAGPFTSDPGVLAVAVQFLRVISWNFVAVGLVFAASGMFQAFGDTRPSFLSSASRLLTFGLPAIWLTAQPAATLLDFWHLSLLSAGIQAVISMVLLRRAFGRLLPEPAFAQQGAMQSSP